MTFCHKSTFLRSAILEDPFCLGDLIGPEDVLRIERTFPELFQPPEFDSSPRPKSTQPPLSNNMKSSIRLPPRPKSTTVMTAPTTFEKLYKSSKSCSRERCKIQTQASQKLRPVPISRPRSLSTISSYKLPPLPPKPSLSSAAVINRRQNGHESKISLPPPPVQPPRPRERVREASSSNDKNNVNASILSDILEYSEDKTENLSLSSNTSTSTLCDSDFLNRANSPPHNVIFNLKPQQQATLPSTKDDLEDHLTEASMNRCEQLLLAKLLASKYEKDGKFQKRQNSTRPSYSQQVEYKKVDQPLELDTKPMLHSILLESVNQQNKSFENLLHNYPSILEKIAYQLIHAEITKIMHEEKENLLSRKKKKIDVAVGTRDEYSPRGKEKYKNIDKMKNRDTNKSSCTYKDKGIGTNCTNSGTNDDSDTSESEDEEEKTIVTPELTPPYRLKSTKVSILNKKTSLSSNSNSEPSSLTSVQTPILSRASTPPPNMLKKERQKENDGTDCSELEDFVASEPIIIVNTSDMNRVVSNDKLVHDTPEVSIKESKNDQHTNSTVGEHEKECVDGISSLKTEAKSPNDTLVTTDGDCVNNNNIKNNEHTTNYMDKVPEKECIDEISSVKSEGKSRNVTFDLDNTEVNSSSLTSILEMISDGELIVPTGERSPGEVSWALNISPGMHFYRSSSSNSASSCSNNSSSSENSTYGFE